jgi:hypothetical protein
MENNTKTFIIHSSFDSVSFHAFVTHGRITRMQTYRQDHMGAEEWAEVVAYHTARGGLPENVSFWNNPLFFGSVSETSKLDSKEGFQTHAMAVSIYKIVPSDDVVRNPLGHYLREVWDASEKAKVLLEIQRNSSDFGPGFGTRIPVGYWINGDKYGGVPRNQFPKDMAEKVFPIWDRELGKSR